MDTTDGNLVLERAIAAAERRWGARLVAGYALGSLAHGGFSPVVSDVDMAVVLDDPLQASDGDRVAAIEAEVRASGLRLADRLSIFWGSVRSLQGTISGGRFPAYDRGDLIRNGRLLSGREVRQDFVEPTERELIVESAGFVLNIFAKPARVTDGSLDATALLKAPERLLSTETVRVVTKLILFPVRFLHTVDTGRVGTTEAAVAHFLAGHSGAIAELVRTGFQWRTAPPTGEAEKTRLLPILRSELVPLYLLFLDTYAKRLQEYGLSELSEGLAAWGARLSEPATSS